MTLPILLLGMLLASDVWTVYGIVIFPESTCTDCFSSPFPLIETTNATTVSSVSTPIFSDHAPSNSSKTIHITHVADPSGSTEAQTVTTKPPRASSTSMPPAPTAKPTNELSLGAKIGIGLATGAFAIALMLVALEAFYLRRKRQERALQRAVEEVERGMDKSESEERIVLESRVSIVFEDESEEEEEERGRPGMSLPRRE